ncbi:olfactory receptor 52D1-like [Trichomycterus rosablanca]|uniref:olfactory receptor 52D1-like n=1 Tax=Trichomycterus rosablanca TaxID=2290929 RepID=UPI002F356AE2
MASVELNTSNAMLTFSGMKDLRPRYAFVFIFLTVYLLILVLNLILILTIVLEKSLHDPMYLFLCNLCLNGLYGSTGFYPNLIYNLLAPEQVISYIGCYTQAFVIYTSFMCEYTTLVIMAYDRYVAICRPLEYHSIIVSQTVMKAILYSWTFPILVTIPSSILASRLPLCRTQLDRLYCYNWAMVRLVCVASPAVNVFYVYGIAVICVFAAHAVFVLVSYHRLIVACRTSHESKKKFMRTCVPHLVSLVNFTVTLLFDTTFTRYAPEDVPAALRYFFQVEVLLVPPLLNPLMYGLKLSEVRRRIFQRHKSRISSL